MSDLEVVLKNWSFPAPSPERAQLTLRIPLSDHQRLLALKEIYPNRSVNDMVVDILGAALNEIVSKLPSRIYSEEEIEQMERIGTYQGEEPWTDYGLAGRFQHILKRIQNDSNSKEDAA
jgi:hypothetical protein